MLDFVIIILMLALVLGFIIWFILEFVAYVKTFSARRKKVDKTKEFYNDNGYKHRYRNTDKDE